MNSVKRGLAIAAFTAIALMPTTALAADSTLETRYQNLYDYIDKHNLGPYEDGLAGRNLAEFGVTKGEGIRPATDSELHDGIAVMQRMKNPVVYDAPVEEASTTTSTYSSASSSTAMCESGGDYTAVDSTGTYGGAYQFDQGTWDAYAPSGYEGTDPASAPPAVQDAAAANVPYDAWPSC